MIARCEICGKAFYCSPKRYNTSKTHCCSRICNGQALKSKELNCKCAVCGTQFHLKKSELLSVKQHCCSQKCAALLKRIRYAGKGNPQYGIRGEANSSWKGGIIKSSYGYRLVYSPNHPFANSDGRVFEHRLVAEKYLLNKDNCVEVDGKFYLSPDYVVHHKDFDKENNNVSNLEIMKKGMHTTIHNKQQARDRDALGRFI